MSSKGSLRDQVWTGDLECVFHNRVVSTANTGRLRDAFCTSIWGFRNRLGVGMKGLFAPTGGAAGGGGRNSSDRISTASHDSDMIR